MNKGLHKFLEEMAEDNILKLDDQSGYLFGVKNGYSVCISQIKNSRQHILSVSVCRGGEMPNVKEMKQAVKSSKSLAKCDILSYRVNFIIKVGITDKKTKEYVSTALEDVVEFLKANNYENCCQTCGTQGLTDAYVVGGAHVLLCSPCFASHTESAEISQQHEKKKKESFTAGMVGAFIGSSVGVLAIILLSQLGYVAAVSGVIMAVCALKGYELLGRKLSVKGIVVSIFFMIVMVYIANWIDWAIFVSSYCEIDIISAFQMIPGLIEEEYIEFGDYYADMAMIYMFVILGAVPTIINAVKNNKRTYVTYKMSEGKEEAALGLEK